MASLALEVSAALLGDKLRSRPIPDHPPSVPPPHAPPRPADEHDELSDPPQNRVLLAVLPLGGLDLLEIEMGEGVLHTMGVARESIRWGSDHPSSS